jgi:hypothetical protein
MAIDFSVDTTSGAFSSLPDYFFDKSSDGADPNYPFLQISDGGAVSGGLFDLEAGYPGDYVSAGYWWKGFGSLNGGGAGSYSTGGFVDGNGPKHIEVLYHPTTQSIADHAVSAALLMWIPTPTAIGSGFLSVLWYESTGELELQYNTETGFVVDTFTGTGPVAGSPYKVKVEWQCGTFNGVDHDPDGYIKLYINDVLERSSTNIPLYLTYNTNPTNLFNGVAVGFSSMIGPWESLEVADASAPTPPPSVPPMQRAGYVLFSNDIVEKQSETRLTKTFLQLLAADPPAAVAPIALTLTEVVGDLYDQEGNTITTGRLYVTPRSWLVASSQLIGRKTVAYDISGPISLNLAASNGILYDVEYDPDPNDSVTPINLKPGYFRDVWDIPASATVDIATL